MRSLKINLKQYILDHYGKKTFRDIADDLNVDPATVSKHALELEQENLLPSRIERKQMIDNIIKNNWEKMSLAEMAALSKVPESTIRYRALKLNIDLAKPIEKKIIHEPEESEFFNYKLYRNWLL